MGNNPFRSIKGGLLPPRPPMVVLDRFGKMVEVGHLVLFHNNEDLVFEVTDVRPILNPGIMQAGVQAMQVTMTAQVPVHYPAGRPARDLAVVGESQARAAARAGNNGNAKTAVPDTQIPSETGAGAEDREANVRLASPIVLTDAPDPVAEDAPAVPVSPEGPCSECGWPGPVGEKCVDCGVGTHETGTPTLGDA